MESTVVWIIMGVMAISLAAVTVRLMKVERRLVSLALANKKLDFLLKRSGVEYDPLEGLSPELADALRESGNRFEAIARYRKSRKVGLAEAMRDIDAAIAKTGIEF